MLACPFPTELPTCEVYRGPALLDCGYGAITGLLDRFAAEPGVVVVPLLFVRCLPGGPFSAELYAALRAETLDLLAQHGPFDAVAIVNHGAAEVAGLGRHGDTDYVCAIRAAVGPDVPLGVPFDHHGQMTPDLLDALTVFTALRTAPHRDAYETSHRLAGRLLDVARGGGRPHKAAVPIPILVPGEKAMTDHPPARDLFALLPGLERRPGVLGAELLVGFGWNDTPWTGMTALVAAEDPATAHDTARALAGAVWDRRRDFALRMETATVADGLARAAADGRRGILLSDAGDNTTAGAGGDLTYVLQAALDMDLSDIVVAGIYAPDVVAACRAAGPGASLTIGIGRHISAPARPRQVAVTVEATGDTVDVSRWPDLRGSPGAWCRVRAGGVLATFHAARVSYTAPGHMAAVGIDPAAHRIYVVKVGYLHPEQEDTATRHICLLSPGVADLDFTRLSYRRVPRPCYPLDDGMRWSPAVQGERM